MATKAWITLTRSSIFFTCLNEDYKPSSDSEEEEESDYAKSDCEDEEEDTVQQTGSERGAAIQINRTKTRKEVVWDDVHLRVGRVLDYMSKEMIDVPIFLDALSWGTDKCTTDAKICYARTSLMKYPELPSILRKWWKPPRSKRYKKARPTGACSVMEDFALECTQDIVARELLDVGKNVFKVPSDATEEERILS